MTRLFLRIIYPLAPEWYLDDSLTINPYLINGCFPSDKLITYNPNYIPIRIPISYILQLIAYNGCLSFPQILPSSARAFRQLWDGGVGRAIPCLEGHADKKKTAPSRSKTWKFYSWEKIEKLVGNYGNPSGTGYFFAKIINGKVTEFHGRCFRKHVSAPEKSWMEVV